MINNLQMSFSFPIVYCIYPNSLTCLLSDFLMQIPNYSQIVECQTQFPHFIKNKSELFFQKFQELLRKSSIKYIKKVWTKQEDKLLLELRNQNLRWTQISDKFSESNPQICKRRLQRLKLDQNKWPQQLEQEIKKVCTMKNLKWKQKMKILYQKFPESLKYSKKKIKQRYLTYLDEEIENKPWTIEEDMILIKLIQREGRKWKKIAKEFPGRTELHVKNRYYGCLRKIKKLVEDQMIKS